MRVRAPLRTVPHYSYYVRSSAARAAQEREFHTNLGLLAMLSWACAFAIGVTWIAWIGPAYGAGSMCGDGNRDGRVSLPDAVEILQYGTGVGESCTPPSCDTDSSGTITVIDSLDVLNAVVGVETELDCPAGVEAGSEHVIDFESLAPGEQIDTLSSADGTGPVDVFGTNASFGESRNAALIYDSRCPGGCSGGDTDLGSPNEDFGGPGMGHGGEEDGADPNRTALGNIAIIAEHLDDLDGDGLVDDPDDQGGGMVSFDLDFSRLGAVSVKRLTLIDLESNDTTPRVELFDADGELVLDQPLVTTGNNGVTTQELDSNDGVVKMTVTARGSMGMDDVVFVRDEGESTTTTVTSTTSTLVGPTTTVTLTDSTTTTTVRGTTTTAPDAPTTTLAAPTTTLVAAPTTTITVPEITTTTVADAPTTTLARVGASVCCMLFLCTNADDQRCEELGGRVCSGFATCAADGSCPCDP